MKTQFATMVGSICLDKATDDFGNPAPVTFSIKEVINGHLPWQGKCIRRNFQSLNEAIRELFNVFEMEMAEKNHEWRDNGDSYGHDDDGNEILFLGESGWYNNNNESDGPVNDYPCTLKAWQEKQMTSYDYDNYTVCIVTSAGDRVL